MSSLQKLLGASFAGVGILTFVGAAYAATPSARVTYNGVGRANNAGISAARMPTMPTMSINTTGNLSQNLPSNGGYNTLPSYSGGGQSSCPANATGVYPQCDCGTNGIYNQNTNTCVACDYAGQTVENGACVCPNGTHADAATKSCVANGADTECADGGVRESEYNVTRCMNDVYACVNNGGLPNGINDLFNEELRNSIENGMALCSVQVNKCVTDVRHNCQNMYRSAADVWIDFNARKVQPEYYNFVLRKTGLTPNQAENTCLLLDRNTYGSSFTAVANDGTTASEYNQRVGAYNGQQGNILIKNNPQGATVNSGHAGVDGSRGHYARWDATTADCYIRVAAYNKDTPIKNSWLFGAAGDDRLAEVWQKAGATFSCNKDLFGFSLMNDTSTAAVVGIGGGTLVGAGVGALAGHGARDFSCADDGHRKKAMEQLKKSGGVAILNEYMSTTIDIRHDSLSDAECNDLQKLRQAYFQATTAAAECGNSLGYTATAQADLRRAVSVSCTGKDLEKCFQEEYKDCVGKSFTNVDQCAEYLMKNNLVDVSQVVSSTISTMDAGGCKLNHLKQAAQEGSVYCTAQTGCITADELAQEAKRLGSVLSGIEILQGENNNRATTTLIGAGVGAGAGGIATAITAFVEKSNINCRVGDGLSQVGYGKSNNIETLKDFYVKWNLHLPESVTPTGQATDCNSWRTLCGALTDGASCRAANINWRGPDDKTTTLVHSACAMSGSQCIENYSVAKSYGACE